MHLYLHLPPPPLLPYVFEPATSLSSPPTLSPLPPPPLLLLPSPPPDELIVYHQSAIELTHVFRNGYSFCAKYLFLYEPRVYMQCLLTAVIIHVWDLLHFVNAL